MPLSSVLAIAALGTPHKFWGLSTSGDPHFKANNCTECHAAGNFFVRAPAHMQKQPTFHKPVQPTVNVTALLTKYTIPALQTVPAGFRSLNFDGGCPCAHNHPKDDICTGGKCAACDVGGVKFNFTGIWWDHGFAQVAVDFKAMLTTLQALDAPLVDMLTLDSECELDAFTVTSWQTAYNPSLSQACSDAHFDAIQDDPRFPKVLSLLKRRGFDVVGDPKAPHWLRDSLVWNASDGFNVNLAAWHVVMRERVAAYKNQGYTEPMLAYNPKVKVSDYDTVAWDVESCTLEMNGFYANGCKHTSTTTAHVGTHLAPEFYGWMHNVSDGVNYPGVAGMLKREFGLSEYDVGPFNALRWSVYQMRSYRLAAPEVGVKPWIAYRSWAGDRGPGDPPVGWTGTDFYEEMVLHLGLLGADDFLLFNPCFDTCCWVPGGAAAACNASGAVPMCTLDDNIRVSKILTELTAAVGFEERKWIPEPTPGGWKCNHLLSAMETPEARVWRFTPSDGHPMSYVRQVGSNVTVSLMQGATTTLTFEGSTLVTRMVNASTPPVSHAGIWISQKLSAPMPEGWHCQLS
jgi:hypothetical protein